MTYPPQQPGNSWPDPAWTSPEQQQPQPPALDPYGAPTSPPVYPSYQQQPYPPAPGYAPYGYGMPAPAGQSTNGTAVAALVVSIVGALGICAYGIGGIVGVVGAILGHVARKQIRQSGEGGDGLALAGVIVGWIAAAIGLITVAVLGGVLLWASTLDPTTTN
jgi:hypothetical protein